MVGGIMKSFNMYVGVFLLGRFYCVVPHCKEQYRFEPSASRLYCNVGGGGFRRCWFLDLLSNELDYILQTTYRAICRCRWIK